jgi:hypothetical protein
MRRTEAMATKQAVVREIVRLRAALALAEQEKQALREEPGKPEDSAESRRWVAAKDASLAIQEVRRGRCRASATSAEHACDDDRFVYRIHITATREPDAKPIDLTELCECGFDRSLHARGVGYRTWPDPSPENPECKKFALKTDATNKGTVPIARC